MKKSFVIKLVTCISLVVIIWSVFLYEMIRLDRKVDKVLEDDFSWVAQIDNITFDGKKVILEGFAFEIDKNAEAGDYDIVLQDIESGKYLYPKMEYTNREDVNEYFRCVYRYLETGFIAEISADKLDLDNKQYEVMIKPQQQEVVYKINTFLTKDGIQYINPKEFVPFDVMGTDLEEIVTNGKLRMYEAANGMYVYQYNGDMYWIAEEDYSFVDGDTHVYYRMSTTQTEKLSAEHLDKNLLWDSHDFTFSDNELVDINTGKYRVTKKELPNYYSITKIWTGNYINDWVWLRYFRPWYDL